VIAGRAAAPTTSSVSPVSRRSWKRRGIDTSKMWMEDGEFTPEGGLRGEIAAVGREVHGGVCANDEMAVGACRCFQKAGVQVPQQVSVLGYDDTHSAEFTAPQLTSVHIPWSEMTMNGLNYLLNRCYDLKRPVTRNTSCMWPNGRRWRRRGKTK
jgi:LacI family transcriptional regulator